MISANRMSASAAIPMRERTSSAAATSPSGTKHIRLSHPRRILLHSLEGKDTEQKAYVMSVPAVWVSVGCRTAMQPSG